MRSDLTKKTARLIFLRTIYVKTWLSSVESNRQINHFVKLYQKSIIAEQLKLFLFFGIGCFLRGTWPCPLALFHLSMFIPSGRRLANIKISQSPIFRILILLIWPLNQFRKGFFTQNLRNNQNASNLYKRLRRHSF